MKIKKAVYSKFETRGAEPTLKLLMKIAGLYHVSLDELLGRQFTPDGKVTDQLLIKKEMTKEINILVKQMANEFIQS